MASGKKTAKKPAAKTKAVARKAEKAVAKTKAVAKKAVAKTRAVAKKAAAKTRAVAKTAVAKTKAVAKKAAAKTKAVAKKAAAKSKAVVRKAAAKTKAVVKKAAKKAAARTNTAAKKRGKKTAAASPRAAALHRMATRHNWDDGLHKLQRILDDPDCDLGTALLIYWMGAPGFDREFVAVKDSPDWRRPVTKFLRQLEKRLLARRFATADILFNPRFDRSTLDPDGHDWTAEYGDVQVKRPIPAALLEPSAADPDWETRGRKPAKGPGRRLT